MTIIITAMVFLAISFFFAKRIFIKNLKFRYERSLIKGDRKRADQLGKFYYISLNEEYRKANGITDIEVKISEDFSAFNNHHFSIF